LCEQAKNESDISAMENSCSVAVSEQKPLMTQSQQHHGRNAAAPAVGAATVDRHNQTLNVLGGADTVCLSPAADSTSAASTHWLNHSLPVQSHCRAYSEDGTPLGSTCLRRGRPNSLKSGLPSPLQRSLLVSTAAVEKEVAVIDTSPILSTYCVTSAVRKVSEHVASVLDDENGSTLVDSGSKVDVDAPIETTLEDSSHNQAFTESMLADPDFADGNLFDAGDTSYTADCDRDHVISCHEVSKLSLPVLSESSVAQLLNPPISTYSDPALKSIQSSTTSLDSAIDTGATNMNEESHLELERSILRSSSKQSIISHDSGVGAADILSPTTQLNSCEASSSHCFVRRGSTRRQSVNLQVTTDVRHFLFKAGVPLEAVVGKENSENANKPRANADEKLQCGGSMKVTSECEQTTPRLKLLPPSSAGSFSCRHSKLMPVLPISTNLVRVSSEHYSESAKRYVTSSAAVVAPSPAVSTGAPRIKSALLTPSSRQCLTGVDGTSQLRSRLRGKPVKRLQSLASPYPNHSPVNPLSPRHVATSTHATVAVPFDIDV